jgi:hypothetical protein
MHGPVGTEGSPTYEVAICQVCGCQWQVKSNQREDAKGCSFCDAPESAITIISEAPQQGGAIIHT